MEHDYSRNDWREESPWWVPLAWFVYLVLTMYGLLWIGTSTAHHIDCWHNDQSIGCALNFNDDEER